jgi:hypothetical protein
LSTVARDRPLALASYISNPGGRDVTRAVRAALCHDDRSICEDRCWAKRDPQKPCGAARSALFGIRHSAVPRDVLFFYLNAGPEIGRVEVPSWVASDPNLLDMAHALVYDQCTRGFGYPAVLIEAHEQAVVTEADRQEFWQLVRLALAAEALPETTSAKAFSKRAPWA